MIMLNYSVVHEEEAIQFQRLEELVVYKLRPHGRRYFSIFAGLLQRLENSFSCLIITKFYR